MPEYLAPGVYVEEISTGPKPIEGVSTSNAGFVGGTERGPEYVKLITSWLDFQRWYGGYVYQQSYLPHAVQGFFDNGGKRCFITRVTGQGASHSKAIVDGALHVRAIGRGNWGDRIVVRVLEPGKPREEGDTFKIQVLYFKSEVPDPINLEKAELIEEFDNVTFTDGTTSAVKVLNASSRLIRVWWDPAPKMLTIDQAAQLSQGGDGADVTVGDFEGHTDPLLNETIPSDVPNDLLGRGTGLNALADVDEISLLLAPDEVREGLTELSRRVIGQCQKLKDRFAVCSVSEEARNDQPQQILVDPDTLYGALYYPWIRVYDPSVDDYRILPPSGHVAGLYARVDVERGVHKAPANEVLRGAAALEFPVTKEMQDFLNPKGVNCIRDFRSDGRGIRVWGARTMSSDPEWKYVNVRRLFIFIEESIDEGTQWVVFEPNYEATWAKVRRSITNFLISVWRSGALQGVTQEEAFFVRCDRTTMTEDDINNGRLICYIGVAPVKPAEFVIFRIGQKTLEATS